MTKRTKRLWIILASLLALLLAASVFLSAFLKPRIRQALDDLVRAGSDSLYQYHYDKLSINWFGGGIAIHNFQLYVDSNRYAQLARNKKLPAITVQGELPDATISGIRLLPFLFNRRIRIHNINLEHARWIISRHFRQSPPDSVDMTSLYQRIKPNINGLFINRINIADLQITYRNADSARAFQWTFNKANAYFENMAISEKTEGEKDRVMYADNFFVGLQDAHLQTGDSLYAIGAGKVTYSTKRRIALIDRFTLQPTLEHAAFYQQIGHQKERYELSITSIALKNLSLGELIADNRLKADSLLMNEMNITVLNDRTQKPSRESKMGKFPNQLLHKINLKLYIAVLKAENARVAYIEKQAENGREARVDFTGLNGVIHNISNDSSLYGAKDSCRVKADCRFLNKTPLSVRFAFALSGNNGDFQVTADFGKATAAEISSLTGKLENLTVEDFDLNGLHCRIRGNQYEAITDLGMEYENLKITLHRKTGEKAVGRKKGILSFIVNALAVYNDNPAAGKKPREANGIHYRRKPDKSFFNLIWKSMLTGMGHIILKPAAGNLIMSGD